VKDEVIGHVIISVGGPNYDSTLNGYEEESKF
jgi:hypothetical protein